MERWEVESLVVFGGYLVLYIWFFDPFVGRVTGLRGDPFAPHDRGEMLLLLLLYPRGWIFLLVSAVFVAWFILSRIPGARRTADGTN